MKCLPQIPKLEEAPVVTSKKRREKYMLLEDENGADFLFSSTLHISPGGKRVRWRQGKGGK